jgi:hypothetical protein
MQCPKCSDLGLESEIIRSSEGWVTTAYRYPFHDDQKRKHHHLLEITIRTHWCKQGHHFESRERYKCWCGWPN